MKLFSLISSAAVITALPITGFCDSQITHLEGRISGLEKTHKVSDSSIDHQANQSGYNKSYQTPKPADSNQAYTEAGTDTYPKVVLDYARGCRNQNMPYFDLEFLWLRAIEDSLSYAWDVDESSGNDRTIKIKDQNFKFKPGFRIGFGYNLPYDGWYLHTAYTWHYTYVHSSVLGTTVQNNGSVNGTIIGTLAILPLNDGAPVFVAYERARSHWQNQFNVWDLDLGRNYYVGKHLAVKPTVGLKAALIRQHLQAFMYNADRQEIGQQQQPLFVIGFDNAFTRFKSRFWGVGPKLGASGEWELGAGFSFFGNVHASLLYGQFKTKNSIVARVVADRVEPGSDRVGNNEGGHIFDNYYRLRAMTYASMGLEWSRCFWDWFYFRMHLGWEGQYWWQQMEFLNFKDLSPDGDLSLTGVNAGFRFDF